METMGWIVATSVASVAYLISVILTCIAIRLLQKSINQTKFFSDALIKSQEDYADEIEAHTKSIVEKCKHVDALGKELHNATVALLDSDEKIEALEAENFRLKKSIDDSIDVNTGDHAG